jgi:Fis family transcriptional regulator, factor for inversion stimulation protein
LEDQLQSLVLRMYKGGIRYSEALREFQKIFILAVLREQKGNRARAAKTLDMHRDTLRRFIRDFQLDIRSLRGDALRRPPGRVRPLPLEKKERAT